jgi:hypothetical protein
MRKAIFIMAMLCACSAREAPETVVLKYTWVWCWEKCGKADKLAAVSNAACVCSNGAIVPLQPQVVDPFPEPSLVDRLSSYLKGEEK